LEHVGLGGASFFGELHDEKHAQVELTCDDGHRVFMFLVQNARDVICGPLSGALFAWFQPQRQELDSDPRRNGRGVPTAASHRAER
jgi:hypothetical protein